VTSAAVVFYHDNCEDGFTAWWVAQRALEARGVRAYGLAVQYGHYDFEAELAAAEGMPVFVLDFCFTRPEMERLAAAASSLVVCDHHKTAEAALAGFMPAMEAAGHTVHVDFDMKRSGAGVTWGYFHAPPPPLLVRYIEDRDLWRWVLPHSKAINAYLGTLPHDLEAWDTARHALSEEFAQAVTWGRGALASVDRWVGSVVDSTLRWVSVPTSPSFDVPCINVGYKGCSEAVGAVADRHPSAPFALGWWVRGDGQVVFSLRSRGEVDVSDVAKQFGGGGHAKAAGFTLSKLPGWLL